MNFLIFSFLFLSGATSLIYELLWTRILSFAFGSTSLAFAAVLAVFFLGLAAGAQLGGRFAASLKSPLLAYGILEGFIGIMACILFPLLFRLDWIFSIVNTGGIDPLGLLWRFFWATLTLFLPTMAMGATFPIVVEYFRRGSDAHESQLGWIYGINTFGAFAGVYGVTHWLLPFFGLNGAYFTAATLNIVVMIGAVSLSRGSALRFNPKLDPTLFRLEETKEKNPNPNPNPNGRKYHFLGLLLLAVSGFTTLGYEIAWSRVLTIAMEGSLYGIGATLGAFLAGIGLGSLIWTQVARYQLSPKTIVRLYVLLCLCMTAYLACSPFLLSVEGYGLKVITLSQRNMLGIHLNFLIAIVGLLPITLSLGFLFPAAFSLLSRHQASRSAGMAYALNTACSVLGSLLSAAWLMDALGIEGLIWVNVLVLLAALAISIWVSEEVTKQRWAFGIPVLLTLVFATGYWPEINAKSILLVGEDNQKPSLSGLFRSLSNRFSGQSTIKLYKDGVGSTLTVTQFGRNLGVQSNGLSQSGRSLDPPHYNMESALVGLFPVMHRPDAQNALVIGLGAGISVGVLRKAGIEKVEVIELEVAMPAICRYLYPKNQSPLDDSGVRLHLDDARNFLVRNQRAKLPRHWQIIASQPAHPWVSGAADLFTLEMFQLVYKSLDEGGVFGQWFMPSGIDDKAFQSIVNAFGTVFDHVAIYRTSGNMDGFYFIGIRGDSRLDVNKLERLFLRTDLHSLLTLNAHTHPADLLRYNLVPLCEGRSLVDQGPVNTDRNAYIETRMPLLSKMASVNMRNWNPKLYSGPSLKLFSHPTIAESLMVYEAIDRLSVTEPNNQEGIGGDSTEPKRLVLIAQNQVKPWSAYAKIHSGIITKRLSAQILLDTLSKTSGLFRGVLLRLYARSFPNAPMPAFPLESVNWPFSFSADLKGAYVLALADQGRFEWAFPLLGQLPRLGSTDSALVLLMAASQGKLAWPKLNSGLFDSVYACTRNRYTLFAGRLKSVEEYCLHMNLVARAEVLRGFSLQKRNEEGQRLLLTADRLKKVKDWKGAAMVYATILQSNPAMLTAFLGLAETYGALHRSSAYDSLAARVSIVFPLDEVAKYRVQEVYNLVSTLENTITPHF